ncbi:hypothetical protein [Krasilnikovia sp. MM14-A1259]|uniref:hypothetical protein n=1 Tax=Krasilnikovia sp. MM14-A1259 TaxID=3373539 RepID=UPI00399CB35E
MAMLTGCGSPGETPSGPAPSGKPSAWTGSGVQPLVSLKAGVEDRVEPALLPKDIGMPALEAVSLDVEGLDDVASGVCGLQRGNGVYEGMFGLRRQWRGKGVAVEQFVSAFGAITATKAIDQVKGSLACGSYRDRSGEHTEIATHPVDRFPNIDGSAMFCETLNARQRICTVLLAREDMLSRVTVQADDHAVASSLANSVASRAASALEKAW